MTSFANRSPSRRPSRSGVVLLSLVVLALPAGAQPPVSADTMYLHAHGLVSRGQGAQGRALVDSLLLVMPPGTPAYAEGLFWRAVTASRVEDAERDYLRLVIEYPLSRRSEDALIRLAELEMMRGDRTRAQRHLQRLIIEHPNGPGRARASYWLARVFFEGNDLPRACNELNVARSRAAANDVELRNQVDYQALRCVGVTVVIAPPTAPPTSVSATNPSTSSTTTTSPLPSTTSVAPPSGVVAQPVAPSTIPSAPPVAAPIPAPTAAPIPAPIAAPPQAVAASAPVPPARETARRAAPGFTVQVAAFPTKAAADTFMKSLRVKGYDVRVWGTEYPFRVRIGRFATRAEATTVAQELRTRMIAKDAFVVEAEVR